MNDIYNNILKFIPFNEQELVDKETILKYLKTFDNLLLRENVFAHLTSSAFVVNQSLTHTLMVYHNIFDGYIYPGGHADGNDDLLSVALREVKEETGLDTFPLYDGKIFGLQINPTKGHIKRNKFVSAHNHLDIIYLLCAKDADMDKIRVLESENKDVKWFALEECYSCEFVDWVRPINSKLVKKIKSL